VDTYTIHGEGSGGVTSQQVDADECVFLPSMEHTQLLRTTKKASESDTTSETAEVKLVTPIQHTIEQVRTEHKYNFTRQNLTRCLLFPATLYYNVIDILIIPSSRHAI
jgi:hypothetical protein